MFIQFMINRHDSKKNVKGKLIKLEKDGLRTQLLLLILPVVGYPILRRFDLLSKDGHPWRFLVGLFASAALVLGSTVMVLPAFGQGANAPAAMFRNPATTIDRWAEHFGFLTAEVLDLSRQGSAPAAPVLNVVEPEVLPEADSVERNALPGLDFAALNEKTDDPALQNLNTYLSTVSCVAVNIG